MFRFGMLALAGAFGAVPLLNAFTKVGHGKLIGSTSVRADYDSNIFVTNSQVDDYVGTLTGEGRYVRDAGIVTFDAAAGFNAFGFADHSELNSFDPYAESHFGYTPSEKTNARAALSYRRDTIGNEAVNDRTKSNDFLFDGSLDHFTTEKLGLRGTASYSDFNYITAGYSNIQSYGVGLHGIYAYSPKLKLLAGVTQLEWWTKSDGAGRRHPSTRDWRYTVGAEGELAPKVTGAISAGLLDRQFRASGFSGNNEFYLSARVTWAAAEKTAWTLLAGQDMSLTAADQSAKSANVTLSVNQRLSEKLSAEASAGLDRSTYVGFRGVGNRKDHGYTVRGRVAYALNDTTSIDVSAGYRNTDSTVRVSDFDRLNLGAGVSFRF